MRILVTGSTGFIGSRLVEALRERGHDVHELVRYIAGGRYDYYGRATTHFADMRDPDSVAAACLAAAPEVIIHLAAESAVSYSFERARDVFEVNTLGTVAMANVALALHPRLFIHASTSEVYGNQPADNFPTSESSRLNATSPYAAAKIAAEEYLRVMFLAKGLPVLIMRPFNTYGRGLIGNSHFVVERAITQALQDGRISLHNSKPYREFMFRDDHVSAYVAAIRMVDDESDILAGETLNICTGETYSIADMAGVVAMEVLKQTGREISVSFSEEPDRPHDIHKLHGDNSRTKELLGWTPQHSLTSGMSLAVKEWRSRLAL